MGKNKKKSKAAKAASARGVVGPNYFQVLTGCIANKNISLILVGESHEDAIDITRIGGGKIKEGWISTNYIDLTGEMVGKFGSVGEDEVDVINIKCGICKRNTKMLPLGKAKEWGNDVGREEIEYMEPGREMVLLWVPNSEGAKGRTFLMDLFIHEDGDDDKKKKTNSRSHHPSEVIELLDSMSGVMNQMGGVKSLSKAVQDLKAGNGDASYTLFQWADLDEEARSMNHRRLLGEDVETAAYDELINNRKSKRQKADNLWTFDDWLLEVKSKLEGDSGEDTPSSLHLLLEAPIPPSEVELCRDLMPGFEHTQAADCIRCLSQDSDESSIDMHDPSCDGFGGYIPYIHRQLLEIERAEEKSFLHCVDCRDLGCQHETEDIHSKEWLDLLDSDERDKLLGSQSKHTHHNNGKCLPDWNLSPEEAEIDRLRDSGVLKSDEDEEDDNSEQEEDELITFPSYENFLNVSEILYYTPHIKISYAPFLGKVVKSFDTWNAFFFELFFGGTISDALSMLDLSSINGQYLHTRSPIMKFWNANTGEYEFHKRSNEENDLTLPMFPIQACLKAQGSEPSRTWCSNIFAGLLNSDCKDLNDIARDIKKWLGASITYQCKDPKEADNEIGGGDWFLAYLRECHRDIYEDIDLSDPEDISKRTSIQGETKKHKIGAIKIPSCVDGFQMITGELDKPKDESIMKPIVSRSSEVMAKIIIDIYMNNLVDAATLAKIGQLISKETEKKNITIVCYLGSCHTKSITDFFMQPNYKFKKRIFAGKYDYEDTDKEGKVIHLPPELWNLKSLFR